MSSESTPAVGGERESLQVNLQMVLARVVLMDWICSGFGLVGCKWASHINWFGLKSIESSPSRIQNFNSIATNKGLKAKCGIYLDIPNR